MHRDTNNVQKGLKIIKQSAVGNGPINLKMRQSKFQLRFLVEFKMMLKLIRKSKISKAAKEIKNSRAWGCESDGRKGNRSSR